MPHPEIDNQTPIIAEPLMLLDEAGKPALSVVAKLGFEIGERGTLRLLEEQQPLNMEGELWFPEAELSSYRYEPEVAPIKPATDVAVIAEAQGARPTTVLDVGVSVGALVRQARVFGDRYWLARGLGEFSLSEPMPFERMPLCYERAFGGSLPLEGGTVLQEPRNPLGRGLVAPLDPREQIPAPNLEDPRVLLTSVRDRPPPVGLGFTSPNWQPRAALAGTYDAKWAATRKPLLPQDFQLGYYCGGAPGLISTGYLRGDEHVAALNLSPEGRLDFALPGVPPPRVQLSLSGETDRVSTLVLDTVIIDLITRRLFLLWRARELLPEGFASVQSVALSCAYDFEGARAA